MSAVVAALDTLVENMSKMQIGENGHAENKWLSDRRETDQIIGSDIEEEIVQLSFQLVRTESPERMKDKTEATLTSCCHIPKNDVGVQRNMEELGNRFRDLLKKLEQTIPLEVNYIDLLYRLMCQTRDIIDGKGEYGLSYRLLWAWYCVFPDMAVHVMEKWVLPLKTGEVTNEGKEANPHPLGSWKDLKHFVYYIRTTHQAPITHPLIQRSIQLINTQLKADRLAYDSPSLCAKWVPREGSKKHKEFYRALAFDFFPEYLPKAGSGSCNRLLDTSYGGDRRESPLPKGGFTGTVGSNKYKSLRKILMSYRTMLAGINKRIDTVQIKQCANTWSEIDHAKTTSITLSKQKKAFLNQTKKGEQRSEREDRVQCATNFTTFVESRVKSGKEVKGKRVGLEKFTKQALELAHGSAEDQTATSVEAMLLDSQWRDNGTQTNNLGKMIAMVDTSGSMDGDPLHVAIALGIRVAEKSVVGRRVLTFSATPKWHSLEEGCEGPDGRPSFVRMVQRLRTTEWGMNTDFYSAMYLILEALVKNKVDPEDAKGMVLAIFSDMQIDQADKHGYGGKDRSNDMYKNIQTKYQDAGYEAPHILFWNLRSTDGFPCVSKDKGEAGARNATMMSGFSAALLNAFCEKGIEALQDYTPWSMLKETLMNPRYDISQ